MSLEQSPESAPKIRKELESQLAYIGESKLDHGYSRAVPELFDLATSYVEDAEAAARAGKSAAWVMGLWDAPLLYACDTIPISLTELGRMGSAEAMTVAEDYFQLPKETCSMVSALLGEWYLRRNTTVKRLVVFNGACEPLNLGWELIRKEGYDVHRIEAVNRPLESSPERHRQMVDFLVHELGEVARWLTGKPIDQDKAANEVRRVNRILGKIRRVLDLRLKNPLYIKSLATMFLLMGSGHYFGKPETFERVLDRLVAEMEASPVIPSPRGEVVPLAWIGGRGQEFGVYKAIDDCGGAVLGWQTPNVFNYTWREDVPPLQSIAEYVLSGRMIGSPVHRLKSIERVLEQTGSKGILFYGYVGCSFGGIYNEIQRSYFHKKGIPSISLEGSFQVGPPSGQLLTRVRAFVEMLSYGETSAKDRVLLPVANG
jgi:benzoyl-CoA reductase/2-hydroxyglutaryl-CoA dehydratase subunit BcrC/BadD/HgdB